MAKRKVNTATLIRSQIYTLRHPDNTPQNPIESLRFERNVPRIIDDPKILKILEELYDEVSDGDGELYDKPLFRVDRGVMVDEDDINPRPRKTKLAADRKVKTRRRRVA